MVPEESLKIDFHDACDTCIRETLTPLKATNSGVSMRIFWLQPSHWSWYRIHVSCTLLQELSSTSNSFFFFVHIATGLVPGASGTFIRTFKEMLNNRISYFRYFVQPDVFSFSSEWNGAWASRFWWWDARCRIEWMLYKPESQDA